MLKPELLRVLALTGASVAISVLTDTAMDSQSRRPLESTVASAEKACEPQMPLTPSSSSMVRYKKRSDGLVWIKLVPSGILSARERLTHAKYLVGLS